MSRAPHPAAAVGAAPEEISRAEISISPQQRSTRTIDGYAAARTQGLPGKGTPEAPRLRVIRTPLGV